METKVTKTNVVSNEVKSAIKEIVNDSKLAKDSVKSKVLGVMYFVNQLNKLAKKNEFIDGVSLSNFGKRVKSLSNEKELVRVERDKLLKERDMESVYEQVNNEY